MHQKIGKMIGQWRRLGGEHPNDQGGGNQYHEMSEIDKPGAFPDPARGGGPIGLAKSAAIDPTRQACAQKNKTLGCAVAAQWILEYERQGSGDMDARHDD